MQRESGDSVPKRGEGLVEGRGCLSDPHAVLREGGLASVGALSRVERLAERGGSDTANPGQSQYRHRYGHPGGPGGTQHQKRAES